jgi:hypothetical protein
MSSTPTRATIYEDTAITCMARIMGDDAAPIVTADVTSITLKTFLNYGTTATTTTVIESFTNIIFDTLQGSVAVPDARWTKDTTGYNFRYQIPESVFDTGDSTYRCEFLFDLTDGSQPDLFVIFSVDTVEVLST